MAVSGFDGPGFPHPHLKVTLTSWESHIGVVSSLNGGVVELARGIVRQVSVLWGLGMLRAPDSSGNHAIVPLVTRVATEVVVFI